MKVNFDHKHGGRFTPVRKQVPESHERAALPLRVLLQQIPALALPRAQAQPEADGGGEVPANHQGT